MRRPRRWLHLASISALFAATLGLVGPAPPTATSAASSAQQDDPLRIAIAGYENNLTPFAQTFESGITEQLLNMVYDSLFYSPYDAPPEPWLAKEARVSDDDRVWTIDIREGIRWHDGRPLTAADVAFSYQYFFDEQNGRYSHHVNDLPFLTGFEVIDTDTVRFTCREACPTLDIDPGASMPIIPKHIFENVDDPASFTDQPAVGTGPYRVTRMDSNQGYELTANQNYFKGSPLVDRIEMPVIQEPSAMFLALRSGEVDAVSRQIPPEAVGSLEGSGLELLDIPVYQSTQINFNNQRAPFDNRDFRMALNLAVEAEPIAETLYQGRAEAGTESYLDPDVPFAAPGLDDQYDPERAREILDSLRFTDRDGDGVRETPRGDTLQFEILVGSNEPQQVRAAQLTGDQLSEIGVSIAVTPLDSVTLSDRRSPPDADEVDVPETTRTGNYDMYVTEYEAHYLADPDGLLYAFHCPGETGFGAYTSGYCNEDFDRLVDEASRLGAEERTPLLQQATEVMYRDPPVISLYFPDGLFAFDPDAYSGWKPESGYGIIHKRSFLPGPRDRDVAAEPAADDGGGAPVTLIVVLAAGGVAVVGAMVLVSRRRKGAVASEGEGPEVD